MSSIGSYSVSVESGLADRAFTADSSIVAVADERFATRLTSAGIRVITIGASEEAKSLDAIPGLVGDLRRLGATRKTKLLALGGGIIQDIVAFIASIYMRGVPWTYIPTTFLAMADSCIGGKSSINVGPYKNLVGTFHPPDSILIDPSLTLSLSTEQRVSGLIEACKICYCRGPEAFKEYLDLKPSSSMGVTATEGVVVLSLLSKKWFIEKDEFDRAERLLLNFGHTFGHAMEGASHFRISHGVAVGVGILCAIRFGELTGRTYAENSRVHIFANHIRHLLDEVPMLSKELGSLSAEDVLDRFESDKKHDAYQYSLILVAEGGHVELVRISKTSDSRRLLEQAVKQVAASYSVGARA